MKDDEKHGDSDEEDGGGDGDGERGEGKVGSFPYEQPSMISPTLVRRAKYPCALFYDGLHRTACVSRLI